MRAMNIRERLFCLALASLYWTKVATDEMNQLFDIEVINMFAKGLLTIIKSFSDDIKMEFGMDTCSKPIFSKEN